MTHRLMVASAVLAGLVLVGPTGQAADNTVATHMNGAKEISDTGEKHVGDRDGKGDATVTIDPVTNEICFVLTWAKISEPVTGAHIHVGGKRVAGPIVVSFISEPTSGGGMSGCLNDEDADAILAAPGDYYVNVHNADFPSGAIRGQLHP